MDFFGEEISGTKNNNKKKKQKLNKNPSLCCARVYAGNAELNISSMVRYKTWYSYSHNDAEECPSVPSLHTGTSYTTWTLSSGFTAVSMHSATTSVSLYNTVVRPMHTFHLSLVLKPFILDFVIHFLAEL